MKVVTGQQMRDIEQRCVSRGISLHSLMERAGSQLAEEVSTIVGGGNVVVLVGPGNNGGDGLVCAETLHSNGVPVSVYAFHRENLHPYSGRVTYAQDDPELQKMRSMIKDCTVAVDALLGTGTFRPPEGQLLRIIETLNQAKGLITRFAADIPTGVNPDTGSVPTQAVHADRTLTFGAAKVGNVVYPGSECGGTLRVCDIGIPPDLFATIKVSVPDDADIEALLPTRKRDSNKGNGGRLLLVGGSRDFHGAPALCAAAAYRIGAGIVQLATIPEVQQSVAAHVQEVIYSVLPEENGTIAPSATKELDPSLAKSSAVAIGPGLGLTGATEALVRSLIDRLSRESSPPAVIDADALNVLARTPDWWIGLSNVVITPHPGEMARLSGQAIPFVQSDRLGTALEFAIRWNVVVVLKGAGTVIASPQGDAVVNPTGGPNLSTAGTGDVLTGIVGGLLAQGIDPFEAAVSGVYLHGRVGDMLRNEQGAIGTVASDLPPFLPSAYVSIVEGAKSK